MTLQRQQSFISNLMAHGATYLRAFQQSIGALENMVVRQTFLMSYMDAFFLLAIMNACCIPLVILTIKKRAAVKAAKVEIPDAH
jgi:DHA2 family multidrug resistance protein